MLSSIIKVIPLVAFLFCGMQATAQTVTMPSGNQRAVTPADFGPQYSGSGTYTEAWHYLFMFDNGMQATVDLSKANLGRLMGNVTGAQFSISNFGGRSYLVSREYDLDRFDYDQARHRLEFHPRIYVEGAFSGRHTVRYGTEKDDVSYEIDLTISNIVPGFTWGNGEFSIGRNVLGMFIHIPQGRVSGTITINGREQRVSGTAYMDHVYHSGIPPRVIRSAMRFVHHGPESEVGYFITAADDFEGEVVGFGGMLSGNAYRLQRPEEVEVISARDAGGISVPYQLRIHYTNGNSTILNRSSTLFNYSALGELGSIQRTAARAFLGGEVYIVRGSGVTNTQKSLAYQFMLVR